MTSIRTSTTPPNTQTFSVGPQETYAVIKGNADTVGSAVKQNALRVLLEFMRLTCGMTCREGQYSFVFTVPAEEGDLGWLKEKVLRYVDLFGTVGETAARERAERLYRLYLAENGSDGPSRVGAALVRYELDAMYLQYDRWPAVGGAV